MGKRWNSEWKYYKFTNENELLKKKIKELEKENKELQTELEISKGGE